MEEKQSSSKGIYVLLGLLFVLLIGGAAAWLNVTGKPISEPVTENSSQVSRENEISSAESELNRSLNDLDEQLGVITADEESDDDTINI